MQIKDLAHKDGRAGSGGAWRTATVERHTNNDGDRYSLTGPTIRRRQVWHYGTLMLEWTVDDENRWDGNVDTVYTSTGHGSVSDQGGMNRLFRALGMPLRYNRAGGSDIVDVPPAR